MELPGYYVPFEDLGVTGSPHLEVCVRRCKAKKCVALLDVPGLLLYLGNKRWTLYYTTCRGLDPLIPSAASFTDYRSIAGLVAIGLVAFDLWSLKEANRFVLSLICEEKKIKQDRRLADLHKDAAYFGYRLVRTHERKKYEKHREDR